MTVEKGDVVRAVVNIAMPDTVGAVNVWDWFRSDDESSDPSTAEILSGVDDKITDIYTPMAGFLVDGCTVVAATVYQMSFEAGRWLASTVLGVAPIGVVGTDSGDMVPHGVAGLVLLGTNYARHSGRKFLPGLSEAACVDGFWSASCITALLGMATEYRSIISLPASVVLSAILAGNDGVVRGYDAAGSSGTPAYQRRRKPGVGS